MSERFPSALEVRDLRARLRPDYCPKCGWNAFEGPSYFSASTGRGFERGFVEGLRWRCRDCGYEMDTPTLEAMLEGPG